MWLWHSSCDCCSFFFFSSTWWSPNLLCSANARLVELFLFGIFAIVRSSIISHLSLGFSIAHRVYKSRLESIRSQLPIIVHATNRFFLIVKWYRFREEFSRKFHTEFWKTCYTCNTRNQWSSLMAPNTCQIYHYCPFLTISSKIGGHCLF